MSFKVGQVVKIVRVIDVGDPLRVKEKSAAIGCCLRITTTTASTPFGLSDQTIKGTVLPPSGVDSYCRFDASERNWRPDELESFDAAPATANGTTDSPSAVPSTPVGVNVGDWVQLPGYGANKYRVVKIVPCVQVFHLQSQKLLEPLYEHFTVLSPDETAKVEHEYAAILLAKAEAAMKAYSEFVKNKK